MFHPAYPSRSDLRREADARVRDSDDLETLARLRRIVAEAMTAAERLDEIRHPNACWHVAELVETLEGELTNIDHTAAMIGRVLVLEDA